MLAFLGFLLVLYLAFAAVLWVCVGIGFLLTSGGSSRPNASDNGVFVFVVAILIMGYLIFRWLIGY